MITQDTVLTAVFEEITYYRLTVEVDPEEGGTVLFDGKAVSKMYKDYAEGTIVKLTAQAEDGYEFVQFEDGKDEITTEEYKVKVDKKKTVYAIFKKKQQGLDGVQSTEDRVQKLLINGEIYILRGEKVYTVQGQVVK